MSDNNWTLSCIAGELKGRSLVLDLPVMTLGRTDQNTIVIPDKNISRNHVTFFVEKHSVFIRDEESRNGSMVNKKKIRPGKKIKLAVGDEIQIGPHHFLVKGSSKEPPVPEPVKKRASIGYTKKPKKNSNRALLYGVALILIVGMGIAKLLPTNFSTKENKPVEGNINEKELLATPKKLTNRELENTLAKARAALQYQDYLAATQLFERASLSDPTNDYAKNQYTYAKNKLDKKIKTHLEFGTREYEKLNYERAVIEWKKVLSLTKDIDPDLYKQTLQKVKNAEKNLQRK